MKMLAFISDRTLVAPLNSRANARQCQGVAQRGARRKKGEGRREKGGGSWGEGLTAGSTKADKNNERTVRPHRLETEEKCASAELAHTL